MDVMVPGLNGPGTLGALRDRGQDVPAIFLAAKGQRAELEALNKLGPLGVIAKPFDPMGLVSEVLTLWGPSPRSNSRPPPGWNVAFRVGLAAFLGGPLGTQISAGPRTGPCTRSRPLAAIASNPRPRARQPARFSPCAVPSAGTLRIKSSTPGN